MPHIATAMQRSMRRGLSDVVFDSLLGRKRSITGDVNNVKTTFSSWDNCMKASYCKWPVIVAIIVASLIVLSVVWCIVRCACCGMSCCCSCFSFLKCCDCCGGCCDGKRDKPHKHLDDPFPPRQGYQAPAPMMAGGIGGKAEPPQYAQFEVGKSGLAVEPAKLHEDALPPMPSWENASKKHVLTEEEKNAVELGELDPTTGQKIPLMTGAGATGVSQPPSPVHEMGASPYGARPGQGGNNGYMGVAGDQYSQNQNAFNQNGRRYGSPSPGPGYGGQGRGYTPRPQEDSRGYGPPSPQDSYGNPNNGFVGTAVTSPGGYGRPPQRQYSGDTNNSGRPYPPGPQRQYSGDSQRPLNPGRQYSDRPLDNFQPQGQPQGPPRGPSRGPGGPGRLASPPLNNNSGFDFGTGAQQSYQSRPSPPPQQFSYGSANSGGRPSPPLQQGGYAQSSYSGSTAPPTYASRSPPPQQEAIYPGYKPYQPSGQTGSQGAPRVLLPGGGRQPQNWDPVQR